MAKLSEESSSYLQLLESGPKLDLEVTPVKDLRERAEGLAQRFKGEFLYQGAREDASIPGDKSDVLATILKPNSETCRTVMVYFHGGGWCWSSRQTHMTSCEIISQ